MRTSAQAAAACETRKGPFSGASRMRRSFPPASVALGDVSRKFVLATRIVTGAFLAVSAAPRGLELFWSTALERFRAYADAQPGTIRSTLVRSSHLAAPSVSQVDRNQRAIGSRLRHSLILAPIARGKAGFSATIRNGCSDPTCNASPNAHEGYPLPLSGKARTTKPSILIWLPLDLATVGTLI